MRKTAAPISCLCLSSILLLCAVGCVAAPTPYEEYVLARTALRSAQDVDSGRFAAALWVKAQDNYHNGEQAYRNAEFGRAKNYFLDAQSFAEKAENATRLKKFQTGDSFP